MAAEIIGQCLCQATQYQLDNAFIGQLLVCRCTQCKRQTGCSSGVAFIAVPRSSVVYTKREEVKSFSVSGVASRHFCGGCGAFIMMDYNEPHTLWLSLGLLSDQSIDLLLDAYEGSETAYPPSRIFQENIARRLEQYTTQCPSMEKYGTYVPDPCEITARKKNNWTADERYTTQANQ